MASKTKPGNIKRAVRPKRGGPSAPVSNNVQKKAMIIMKSVLKPGECLGPEDSLASKHGVFKLCFKGGCLVLLAKQSEEKWIEAWKAKPTNPEKKSVKACFTTEGLLVVYAEDGSELFKSEPWPWVQWMQDRSSAELVLQDDGNLVAYLRSAAYWASGTWNARYAVLIGVNAYKNFPDQALRAGRNDVLAIWKVCRRLGYRPEHIRVRTSPALTVEDIKDAEVELSLAQPENTGKSREDVLPSLEKDLRSADGRWEEILGEATYTDIGEALQWLQKQLSAPFKPGEGYLVPGILYYSGHGAKVEGQLALCPSDVSYENGAFKNALPFEQIEETLTTGYDENKSHSPIEYLTVVLDCCFAAADTKEAGGPSRSQVSTTLKIPGTSNAPKKPLSPIHPWLQRRIFCATSDNEQGVQTLLGGRWQGAFTWAFTRTLEQWLMKQSSSELFPYINISHAELLMRIRMLLEALSFQQHPVLMDTFANTPVFWSGLERVEAHGAGAPPRASMEPDAKRWAIQVDPIGGKTFTQFLFQDSRGINCCEGIVPNGESSIHYPDGHTDTWSGSKEYWRTLNGGTPTQLVVNGLDQNQLPAEQSKYTAIARSPGWSQVGSDRPALVGPNASFGVTVSCVAGSPPSLTWYSSSGRNLSFTTGTYALTAASPTTSFTYKAS